MSNPRGSLFLISSTFAAFVSRCSVSIFDATAVKLEAGESRMPTEMLHRATACIRSVNRSCLCIKYRAERGNETLRGFFSVFMECLGIHISLLVYHNWLVSSVSCVTIDFYSLNISGYSCWRSRQWKTMEWLCYNLVELFKEVVKIRVTFFSPSQLCGNWRNALK